MTQPTYAIVEPIKVKGAKSVGNDAVAVPFGDGSRTLVGPMRAITRDGTVVGATSPSGFGTRATAWDVTCSAYSSDPDELLRSFEYRHQQVLAREVAA